MLSVVLITLQTYDSSTTHSLTHSFRYAAQNLNYLAGVAAANSNSGGLVTPVFDRVPMRPAVGDCYNAAPWGCGPTAVVEVPPASGRAAAAAAAAAEGSGSGSTDNDDDDGDDAGTAVAAATTASASPPYERVVLDYQLRCNTSADVSCPQWDHVVQLKACCSRNVLGGGGGGVGGATCNAQDGFELGRWITPFGRGIGRWRTDVTRWLPLLRAGRAHNATQSSYCNLTL
jgi:hypothetical protein